MFKVSSMALSNICAECYHAQAKVYKGESIMLPINLFIQYNYNCIVIVL